MIRGMRARPARGLALCATIAMLLVSLSLPAAPVRAAGPVVSNCTDGDPGSLRDAISIANTGDTITFQAGLNCTITLTTGPLFPGNDLTIDATGHQIIVDGGCTTDGSGNCTSGGSTVFATFGAETATLKGLTIQHGNANAECPGGSCGGGIYNGGTMTVLNSTLTLNSAPRGGGIYNSGALTVTDTTLSSNQATGTGASRSGGGGGGIYNDGNNGGTLTVTRGAFTSNHTTGTGAFNPGGAGIADACCTTGSGMTVTNSTFTGNVSAVAGGGIATDNTTPKITGSTFSGNQAQRGAGLFSGSGSSAVTNSTFAANTASGNGGGIDATGSALTATNVTLTGNTAASGGGIENESTGGSPTVTLTNALVALNPGGGDLGGVGTSGFAGDHTLIGDGTISHLTGGTNLNVANPLLGTLGNYGGTTQTVPLLPGSAAIDAGAAVNAGPVGNTVPAADQRSVSRVGVPDIGAFESRRFTATITGGNAQQTIINTPFPAPLALTVTANNPVEPVAGGVITYVLSPVNGATATLSAPTFTLGADGKASVTATANSVAGGPHGVVAKAAGMPSVTFSLLNLPPTITLSPATLPDGVVAQPYGQLITASGGTAPYAFTLTAGALPTGLGLGSDGTLGGAPTASGPFTFTITATDTNGFTGMRQYTVTIAAAPLVRIVVLCNGVASATIKVGETATCTATGIYGDNSQKDLTNQVTWTPNQGVIASVDSSGKALGKTPGTVTVTATQGSLSGQAQVVVSPPTLTGVNPAPAPPGRPSNGNPSPSAPAGPAPAPRP